MHCNESMLMVNILQIMTGVKIKLRGSINPSTEQMLFKYKISGELFFQSI